MLCLLQRQRHFYQQLEKSDERVEREMWNVNECFSATSEENVWELKLLKMAKYTHFHTCLDFIIIQIGF